MAIKGNKTQHEKGKPKKTRQGNSNNTLFSASSRNQKRKPSRGQGK